jgi:aryl-alcohol dehydrogenase-like predicted oxidoreductase
MNYRKFGNTDLVVSEVGFGAWAIGGGTKIGNTAIGWGDADDEISKKTIYAALDHGINFFDTADIYGLGHSEKIIGETVGKSKEVLIATKVGNVAKNDIFTVDYTKQYILAACEKSLRRLKRETIDYYQLHTARLVHLQNGDCIEAMNQLQKEGKIRYWGLSLNTFDPFPEAEYLMQQKIGSGFQLVLNIINQKALPLLEKANKSRFGIIARMPLQFGLLTGKFDNDFDFPDNDHRKKRLTKKVIDATAHTLKPVWKLCDKYHTTKTKLAISYVLNHPEISIVIPGIRTINHVQQNTKELIQLDEEDIRLIEEMGKTEFLPLLKLIQEQG